MNELQTIAVNWLSLLVASLPVSYPFGAGMIAAVNPCGFAMLPAYLALYLGVDDQEAAGRSAVRRFGNALAVAGAVSGGFVILFLVAGSLISAFGNTLLRSAPWLGLVVGAGLVVIGLLMLAGRTLSSSIFERLADRVSRPGERSWRGFFLFGLAYGLASLSCTLPIFMIAVGSALTGDDLRDGITSFASYALGMAVVIVAVTLTLGFLKYGLIDAFRRVMPYVQTLSAGLLIFAGGWIVLYWWPSVV